MKLILQSKKQRVVEIHRLFNKVNETFDWYSKHNYNFKSLEGVGNMILFAIPLLSISVGVRYIVYQNYGTLWYWTFYVPFGIIYLFQFPEFAEQYYKEGDESGKSNSNQI